MRRDLFPYVDQIRTSEKYFDVSRLGILRLLLAKKGACDLCTDHVIVDENGADIDAVLRLNISTRADSPLNWSMALKLHGVRIDGVDHEARFRAIGGGWAHGWHRHMWEPADESADSKKIPIATLDGLTSRDEFLTRGLRVLHIQLNATDHGSELFFP